ncbi:hypothetical protein HKX48_007183 [Thoreauomyces humboldtii]|nr:hypothetical protein HKX48_007183 [Thoreauomyces humboldtii]
MLGSSKLVSLAAVVAYIGTSDAFSVPATGTYAFVGSFPSGFNAADANCLSHELGIATGTSSLTLAGVGANGVACLPVTVGFTSTQLNFPANAMFATGGGMYTVAAVAVASGASATASRTSTGMGATATSTSHVLDAVVLKRRNNVFKRSLGDTLALTLTNSSNAAVSLNYVSNSTTPPAGITAPQSASSALNAAMALGSAGVAALFAGLVGM